MDISGISDEVPGLSSCQGVGLRLDYVQVDFPGDRIRGLNRGDWGLGSSRLYSR